MIATTLTEISATASAPPITPTGSFQAVLDANAEWTQAMLRTVLKAQTADRESVSGDGYSDVPDLLRAMVRTHKALLGILDADAAGQFLTREREAQLALCFRARARLAYLDQELLAMANRMEATEDERLGRERAEYIENGGRL